MIQYSFTTSFVVQAPIKDVWAVLINFAEWHSWWRGVKKIVVNNDTTPPTLQVLLGYTLHYLHLQFHLKEIDPPRTIVILSTGDLIGTGEFTLESTDHQTHIVFNWDVATTKLWMNLAAPILRPFFQFSHNLVMQWFVHGLAKKLHTTILEEKYLTNTI